mmetsp:Transcript_19655/g.33706  ORF Transcript_19655/g.33706 Transcript_19655/m.33706 type:complete len:209 (-) Transcript_19655:616-1242(-)
MDPGLACSMIFVYIIRDSNNAAACRNSLVRISRQRFFSISASASSSEPSCLTMVLVSTKSLNLISKARNELNGWKQMSWKWSNSKNSSSVFSNISGLTCPNKSKSKNGSASFAAFLGSSSPAAVFSSPLLPAGAGTARSCSTYIINSCADKLISSTFSAAYMQDNPIIVGFRSITETFKKHLLKYIIAVAIILLGSLHLRHIFTIRFS